MLGAWAVGGGFSGPSGVAALTDFVRIGMAMEALFWAFLGGWAACYFASGRDEQRRPASVAGAAPAESTERGSRDHATTRGASPAD
jgi:hypothetical protein